MLLALAPMVLLIGPPESGKTILAKRLPTILPALSLAESLETTRIHSVAGELKSGRALSATPPSGCPHVLRVWRRSVRGRPLGGVRNRGSEPL